MPRVLNKHQDGIPADAVYVGRPSKWGNPFSHLKGTLAQHYKPTKDAALAAYEEWLLDPANAELLAAVKTELRGKDLVCFCAPKACHADILLRIANPPEKGARKHAVRRNLDT